MKRVHVAVGVIARGDKVFITLRADHAHQGGKWEFPGGKVELNESATEALARELAEEVGITVLNSQPLTTIEHDYGDKQVKLEVYKVTAFDGEPHGKEGQSAKWQALDNLRAEDFPAANRGIIDALIVS